VEFFLDLEVPEVPLWTGIIRAKINEDSYRPVVGLDRWQ
jgi:hypothetical protein